MTAPPPLIGTYTTPRVRIGQRVTCLYRDTLCQVVSLTNAPIPWPRVRAVGQKGGQGLWVNDTMERAIRTESVEAMKHWFGASENSAGRWRRWAGVSGHRGTPGTRQAVKASWEASVEARRGVKRPADERARCAERAKRLNLARFIQPNPWTPEQEALLGTVPDDVLAERLGRTWWAVYLRRHRKGIPMFKGQEQ